MNVLVERYQRRKYVNQPDSQMLYYVRQKSGTVRVMDINKLADAIEANSSLTAGDVKHSIEAFVEQLRLSLTQGDKVKIDGLGTFHRVMPLPEARIMSISSWPERVTEKTRMAATVVETAVAAEAEKLRTRQPNH